MDNVSSPLEFGRAVNISFIPESGSHLLPELSWPTLTNDFQMPDPAGSMPGQSHGPSDVEVFANPAPRLRAGPWGCKPGHRGQFRPGPGSVAQRAWSERGVAADFGVLVVVSHRRNSQEPVRHD